MSETILLRNVELGKSRCGVCIPIQETTVAETIEAAKRAIYSRPDLLEIRLDHLDEHQLGNAPDIFASLKAQQPYLPLMATYRNLREGGAGKWGSKEVVRLYKGLLLSGAVDLVDLELSMDPEALSEGISFFSEKKIPVLLSYHNFQETPPMEVLKALFLKAEEKGGQGAKIAVMPKTPQDVARLLSACAWAYENLSIPYVGISMGNLGKISRVGAKTFGCFLTFAAEKGRGTAPGQVEADKLHAIFDLMKDEGTMTHE